MKKNRNTKCCNGYGTSVEPSTDLNIYGRISRSVEGSTDVSYPLKPFNVLDVLTCQCCAHSTLLNTIRHHRHYLAPSLGHHLTIAQPFDALYLNLNCDFVALDAIPMAFALYKEDEDGGRMKRLLARCMEAQCLCISGLCNLQVGAHGYYFVTIAIFLFMFRKFLVCRLGISIRFLLDGGEAQLMQRSLGFHIVARVWLELDCVDGGDGGMVETSDYSFIVAVQGFLSLGNII
ncbi:hypothetical protein V8G54_005349 [Vigna mungo]|uniref:Uncharacterized protein n=1 Tax=Vigna mungo TaxID=3915 RepID=A0AAQ3NZX6_VIGMU